VKSKVNRLYFTSIVMFVALEEKADTSNVNLRSFTVQLVIFHRFLSPDNPVTLLAQFLL
jgi:hypothetical protein